MDAPRANYVDFGGSTISEATAADGYTLANGDVYEGLAEGRRTWLHVGKVKNFLVTSELSKRFGTHDLDWELMSGIIIWTIILLPCNGWQVYRNTRNCSTPLPLTRWTRHSAASVCRLTAITNSAPKYTKGYEKQTRPLLYGQLAGNSPIQRLLWRSS